MSKIIMEIRMLVSERLILLVILLAPKNHPHTPFLMKSIMGYCKMVEAMGKI